MTTSAAAILSRNYLSTHPVEAARAIDALPAAAIVDHLLTLAPGEIYQVVNALTPMVGASILIRLPKAARLAVLEQPEKNRAAALLAQLPATERDSVMADLPATHAAALREILDYPEDTAGRLMDSRVFSLPDEATVGRALDLLRDRDDAHRVHLIKLLDSENRLSGVVDVRKLAFSDPGTQLSSIALRDAAVVGPMDQRDEIVQKFEMYNLDELVVVDLDGHILGVVRHASLLDALKGQATLDVQTMVGASKDERALSSSWFALRKRMPWLQINLLTAFLAASVVGLFEETIATFTALAVLLPVVAGQSGNAGAQALAVTMRGLALREITIGHWFRVMIKEVNAGFWNGIAIAITCGIGVFLWSGQIGLVLVIASSMIIAMTMAGMAGALVPIVLKRLGQDPAVASSIILTTVTDVAGFFSFLGIASALSGMLS